MKDLLEYVVKNLVNNSEAVSVEETHDGSTVQLNLTVDPTDMGLIIGKGGQTIRAIRKLIGVRAMMEEVRVYINLVEPEGSSRTTQNDSEDQNPSEPGTDDDSKEEEAVGSVEPVSSVDTEDIEKESEDETDDDSGQARMTENTEAAETEPQESEEESEKQK